MCVTMNSKSTIDLLYSHMDNNSKVGVLNYDVSDDMPIFLRKKKIRKEICKTQASGRSYASYNEDNILEGCTSRTG